MERNRRRLPPVPPSFLPEHEEDEDELAWRQEGFAECQRRISWAAWWLRGQHHMEGTRDDALTKWLRPGFAPFERVGYASATYEDLAHDADCPMWFAATALARNAVLHFDVAACAAAAHEVERPPTLGPRRAANLESADALEALVCAVVRSQAACVAAEAREAVRTNGLAPTAAGLTQQASGASASVG